MDDFTPYGDDFDPILDTLENVLQRCIATRLCLSHEKCYMMMKEGILIGHYILAAGIQVDPAKIQILLFIPTPTTQMEEFDITIKDRPRKENPVTNFLSRMPKPIDAAVAKDQFLDEHLFAVAVQTPWYADVANYLAVGKLPNHLTPNEKKQIVQWSTQFSWIGGYLFHTGADMHIRRCIREDEIFDILKACHDGPCGGHFSNRRTRHKVLQTGYYWPTIFKDAKNFSKPMTVAREQDALFAGNRIATTLNNYHVQHKITTPYHQQANGQVESSNKIIEAILTKTIESHRRDWAARLPEALWVYRTTWRSTTSYSPYQLVFGKHPIFPIEFEIQTLRTTQEVVLDLNEAHINRLQQINELDEIRLSALQNTTLIQQQPKWHDALIKNKVFHEGDWALLYDTRFENFLGKPQTRWLGPYKIQKVHENDTLTLITIDVSGYAFKANDHRVRLHRKPLTWESFC
eukprot:PITA_27656